MERCDWDVSGRIYDVIVIGDKEVHIVICPRTLFDCQPRTRLFHKLKFLRNDTGTDLLITFQHGGAKNRGLLDSYSI